MPKDKVFKLLKFYGFVMPIILLMFLCTAQAEFSETDPLRNQDVIDSNLTSTFGDDFVRCLLRRNKFLCDPDNLLSSKERDQIESGLQTIELLTRQNESEDECKKQGRPIKLLLFNRYQESITALSPHYNLIQKSNNPHGCAKSTQFIFYTIMDKRRVGISSNVVGESFESLLRIRNGELYDELETILHEIIAQINYLDNSYGIAVPFGWRYWLCGVEQPGFVCNPDGVLKENERGQLDRQLEDLKRRTIFITTGSCTRGGISVVVVAVERNITTDFAKDLVAAWNLDPSCLQSLVLVYSPAGVSFSGHSMPKFPLDAQYIENLLRQQRQISGGNNVSGLMDLISVISNRTIEVISERSSYMKTAKIWEFRVHFFVHKFAFVIGLFGNIICLVTLLCCKPLRKNLINTYLVVLVLADTIFTLWAVTISIVPSHILYSGILTWNDWYCIFSNYINHSSVCASANVIVLLTMERFFAIVFPLQHMQYQHVNRLVVVLIFILPMQLWIIYFAVHLFPLYISGHPELFPRTFCYNQKTLVLRKEFIPFYISLVILPLCSSIFVNAIIIIKLRRRPKLQGNSMPVKTNNKANSDDSNRILWILPMIATFRKHFISFWSCKFKRIRFAVASAVSKNIDVNSSTQDAGNSESSRATQETNL
ncbi:modulator of levamisole receptor-1 domain-containing protein [Ditylenchus destructor]|uniref:Modulator of levamisole receptor-1 domain-containing protein n=1 Tax=Ditylenchus destructor TaxID=166010 RepID=A0AAD4MMH7_9BILA|nr:modulator of levamisole receptor-1 domain-containing protein [Ditylenchus destructor]